MRDLLTVTVIVLILLKLPFDSGFVPLVQCGDVFMLLVSPQTGTVKSTSGSGVTTTTRCPA